MSSRMCVRSRSLKNTKGYRRGFAVERIPPFAAFFFPTVFFAATGFADALALGFAAGRALGRAAALFLALNFGLALAAGLAFGLRAFFAFVLAFTGP